MARVFLSYDRDDGNRARLLAKALEKAGHDVWWDRNIAGGAQYTQEIEQALAACDAVVVLWSERSVESAWVRDEAAAGRDKGCLIPATIDGTAPPLGFRQYQTIDLSKWKGSGRSAAPEPLLHAIAAACGSSASKSEALARSKKRAASGRFSTRWVFAGLGALLLLAAGFFAWHRWQNRDTIAVVAVSASDSSSESRSLARDLLIKLGSLQAARSDIFQLVEANQAGSTRPALVLEAGASASGTQIEASLALVGGRDQSLLWSKQFTERRGNEAHLRQQLAVTGGRVLDCALQALNEKGPVRQDVLKLYLNGCASFDELAYGDLRRMIPVMREVTRKAPRFEGAWGKLIQAVVLTMVAGAGDPTLAPQLRQYIAEARRVNPHLAEAYLAEAELLPVHAFEKRLRLTELAARHNPDHPEPHGARAYYLRFVGRMADSVESAKRGTDLNPLSPALQNDYITALSHAGEFDRAEQEIARARQLWPGSSVIADANYRFSMRYGDPRLAPAGEQTGATLWAPRMTKAFRTARTTPTPANVDAVIEEARALMRQEPEAIVVLIQVLGTFDRKDQLLDLLLHPESPVDARVTEVLFRPTMREAWHDPRFMLVAKRLRLLSYWQETGEWPDFCFEPDLAYDCKKEAARLRA